MRAPPSHHLINHGAHTSWCQCSTVWQQRSIVWAHIPITVLWGHYDTGASPILGCDIVVPMFYHNVTLWHPNLQCAITLCIVVSQISLFCIIINFQCAFVLLYYDAILLHWDTTNLSYIITKVYNIIKIHCAIWMSHYEATMIHWHISGLHYAATILRCGNTTFFSAITVLGCHNAVFWRHNTNLCHHSVPLRLHNPSLCVQVLYLVWPQRFSVSSPYPSVTSEYFSVSSPYSNVTSQCFSVSSRDSTLSPECPIVTSHGSIVISKMLHCPVSMPYCDNSLMNYANTMLNCDITVLYSSILPSQQCIVTLQWLTWYYSAP